MKTTLLKKIAALAGAAHIISCEPLVSPNFYHDLIPPDEAKIESFTAPGIVGKAEINDEKKTVTAYTYPGTPLTAVPAIQVSKKAKILPVTVEYISAAFPQDQPSRGFIPVLQRPEYPGLCEGID